MKTKSRPKSPSRPTVSRRAPVRHKDPCDDIGIRLRRARNRRKKTVAQCAAAVGIEPAEWLDMESRDYSDDSAMLGATVAMKASQQLNVDPYWLIFGKPLAVAERRRMARPKSPA